MHTTVWAVADAVLHEVKLVPRSVLAIASGTESQVTCRGGPEPEFPVPEFPVPEFPVPEFPVPGPELPVTVVVTVEAGGPDGTVVVVMPVPPPPVAVGAGVTCGQVAHVRVRPLACDVGVKGDDPTSPDRGLVPLDVDVVVVVRCRSAAPAAPRGGVLLPSVDAAVLDGDVSGSTRAMTPSPMIAPHRSGMSQGGASQSACGAGAA